MDCDIIGSNCSYDTFLVSNDKSKVYSGWGSRWICWKSRLARQDLIQLDSTLNSNIDWGKSRRANISSDQFWRLSNYSAPQIICLSYTRIYLVHWILIQYLIDQYLQTLPRTIILLILYLFNSSCYNVWNLILLMN